MMRRIRGFGWLPNGGARIGFDEAIGFNDDNVITVMEETAEPEPGEPLQPRSIIEMVNGSCYVVAGDRDEIIEWLNSTVPYFDRFLAGWMERTNG